MFNFYVYDKQKKQLIKEYEDENMYKMLNSDENPLDADEIINKARDSGRYNNPKATRSTGRSSSVLAK